MGAGIFGQLGGRLRAMDVVRGSKPKAPWGRARAEVERVSSNLGPNDCLRVAALNVIDVIAAKMPGVGTRLGPGELATSAIVLANSRLTRPVKRRVIEKAAGTTRDDLGRLLKKIENALDAEFLAAGIGGFWFRCDDCGRLTFSRRFPVACRNGHSPVFMVPAGKRFLKKHHLPPGWTVGECVDISDLEPRGGAPGGKWWRCRACGKLTFTPAKNGLKCHGPCEEVPTAYLERYGIPASWTLNRHVFERDLLPAVTKRKGKKARHSGEERMNDAWDRALTRVDKLARKLHLSPEIHAHAQALALLGHDYLRSLSVVEDPTALAAVLLRIGAESRGRKLSVSEVVEASGLGRIAVIRASRAVGDAFRNLKARLSTTALGSRQPDVEKKSTLGRGSVGEVGASTATPSTRGYPLGGRGARGSEPPGKSPRVHPPVESAPPRHQMSSTLGLSEFKAFIENALQAGVEEALAKPAARGDGEPFQGRPFQMIAVDVPNMMARSRGFLPTLRPSGFLEWLLRKMKPLKNPRRVELFFLQPAQVNTIPDERVRGLFTELSSRFLRGDVDPGSSLATLESRDGGARQSWVVDFRRKLVGGEGRWADIDVVMGARVMDALKTHERQVSELVLCTHDGDFAPILQHCREAGIHCRLVYVDVRSLSKDLSALADELFPL
ncbi:MAG: NYN domain-containing protein [Promethearchaeota archaeon]